MPLVAIERLTGERICSLDVPNLRGRYKMGDLACPHCETDMIAVSGTQVIAHFRHKVVCSSGLMSHPESAAHILGKHHVGKYLAKSYPRARVEYEVAFPEIGRRADVVAYLPNDWVEVHEVQLSPITVEELEQRTNDYHCNGMQAKWWFGRSADTGANREWARDATGGYFILEFGRNEKRLSDYRRNGQPASHARNAL